MDPFKARRDEIVAQFKDHAAALFAAKAEFRSAMLAVAQYWNDQANDEVHAHVIASSRATPVWPHECEWTNEDEYRVVPALSGEACRWCGGEGVEMRVYGGYADATVNALELFCAEGSHQNQSDGEAYAPFLVARRTDDGTVDVEVVGHARRVPGATIGSGAAADWPDARARALFDEVCRHADDDGPRTVLSDYLLEAHPDDPRGEAIALALARDLDADTRARRDALFAAHAEGWLHPLGEVIAPGCAHFERGFLARADVFASSAAKRDHVIDAAAWGTVHTIRFTPGSRDLVAPAMLALRSVGPLRDDGAQQIARAPRPWRIEHVVLEDGPHAPLVDATNLPRLVKLDVPLAFRDRVADFGRARWWRQLACLGFTGVDDPGALADWHGLRARLGVPELAITTGGWRLGFTAEETVSVRWGAWHANGSLPGLAELAASLAKVALVSTRERVFTANDVAWLRDRTGRDIMLRA